MAPLLCWTILGIGIVLIAIGMGIDMRDARRHTPVFSKSTLNRDQQTLLKRQVRRTGILPDAPEIRKLAIAWVRDEVRRANLSIAQQILVAIGVLLGMAPLYLIPGSARTVAFVQLLIVVFDVVITRRIVKDVGTYRGMVREVDASPAG